MPKNEDYRYAKMFKPEIKWQQEQDKIGKRNIRQLIESTFNISGEARKVAKSMYPRYHTHLAVGVFCIGMSEAKDSIEGFEVQLGTSGIIHCTCGKMDNLGLDICGHVLFALRYSISYWCGTSDCIKRYLGNLLEGKK
jgi:hypothetical protein